MTFVEPEVSFSKVQGFGLHPAYLTFQAQCDLVETLLEAIAGAPFYHPVTPAGRSMSVAITNLGALGWTSDLSGYRYQDRNPQTARPWPALPPQLIELWFDLVGGQTPPDSCLVNLYRGGARMALHQDRDEADLAWPVVSISLGDTALFRIGGLTRRGPSRRLRLASGDVCVLAGAARLAFHGVDRVIPGTSQLVPGGGRINLTLRRAAPLAPADSAGACADRLDSQTTTLR